MSHPEPILVIDRSEFEARGPFSGFTNAKAHGPGVYLADEPQRRAYFIPRDTAETSDYHLQLIPYVVLVHGEDVFIYTRNKKAGEIRLHDMMSVGIGGHIEDSDHSDRPWIAYLNGTIREMKEEVGLEIPIEALQGTCLGMLHDPDTAVGRVHLGILHVLHISSEEMSQALAKAEESMTDPRLTNIKALADSTDFALLEPWSQWALTQLLAVINKPKPWEDPATLERLRLLTIAGAEMARAATELTMQDKGKEWVIGKDNLESAIGAVSCLFNGLSTCGDISNNSIAKACESFYASIKQTAKHQSW